MENNMIVAEEPVVETEIAAEEAVSDKKFTIDAESVAIGAAGATGLFLAGLTLAKKIKNKKSSANQEANPAKEKKGIQLFKKDKKKQTVESDLADTVAEGNEVKKKLGFLRGKKTEEQSNPTE